LNCRAWTAIPRHYAPRDVTIFYRGGFFGSLLGVAERGGSGFDSGFGDSARGGG